MVAGLAMSNTVREADWRVADNRVSNPVFGGPGFVILSHEQHIPSRHPWQPPPKQDSARQDIDTSAMIRTSSAADSSSSIGA